VLVNLLENAFEALADQPGVVRVHGRVVADALEPGCQWAEITLADSGPGIPPEIRERIFDATFSTRSSGRKLGFGLWWVKSWVQRFGGSISLAAPGAAGSTFVIRLPLAQAAPASAPGPDR
jgi:signal transduction histidine kinase